MRPLALSSALAAAFAAAAAVSPCGPSADAPLAGPALDHWPPAAAAALDAMIARNAHNGSFAAFDMDNTSYRFDIEESLLPFLEARGVVTRDKMDPSLRIIPFRDTPAYNESLYSFYKRLCDIDDSVCYTVSSHIFSNIPLRDLKRHVDDLMAYNDTIPTTEYDNGHVKEIRVSPPRLFRGQIELYNRLMNNGIDVYVVSASSEELVRMVASDPKYGYNVPPQNVIGVTSMLKNITSGDVTSSRKQISDGDYSEAANLDKIMTPFLWAPATWKAGKWAAILTYIDEWKLPILVAGDTPSSDGPMLFHGVDVARGGIHLWVNRADKAMRQIDEMRHKFAAAQAREGRPVTADKNWVIVKPEEIT